MKHLPTRHNVAHTFGLPIRIKGDTVAAMTARVTFDAIFDEWTAEVTKREVYSLEADRWHRVPEWLETEFDVYVRTDGFQHRLLSVAAEDVMAEMADHARELARDLPDEAALVVGITRGMFASLYAGDAS